MRRVILTIGCFMLLLSFTPVRAEIIKIGLTGLVDYVNDPYNLLEGKVSIDNLIIGYYTYDTATPDTSPATDVGDYFHYSMPCGVVLNLEDFVFTTDFNNVKFLMEMVNDYQGQPRDNYLIRSYNNLFLYNGVDVDHISWQLDDYGGTALSSTALPTTAPVLSDWDYNTLYISGGIGGTPPCFDEAFHIQGYVTSVYLIPEPASLILLAIGSLVLNRRSFKKR
jgi:hypothetical protein